MWAESNIKYWRLNERQQREVTYGTITIIMTSGVSLSGVSLSCVSSKYTNSTVGIVNVYSLHNAYRHKAQ